MIKHRGFIFWLSFIMAAVVLAGCASRAVTPLPITPTKAETETSVPTASPTITATRTSKPTSTITPMPTIEPTRDPNATNTPMVPTPVSNQGYRLTEWTPEKSEILIQYLKNYPETLPNWMLGYMFSGFNTAFKAAGLAELESSLHFPEAEQTKKWRWDGAFHQYQAYNEDAPNLYASFIADALNSNETDLANLEKWAAKTIALSLITKEVSPPPGYQNSTVLHFYPGEKAGFSGGFAIWLVEKEGINSAYPLPNSPMVAYGDGDSEVSVVDITGDGIGEAFIQNVDYGSFGAHSGDLTIYRLDQVPPRVVIIEPMIPYPDITLWSVREDQAGPITSFNMPAGEGTGTYCSTFRMEWQYQWQKDRLKLFQIVPPSEEEMEKDHFCTRILASVLDGYLEEPSILAIYKNLLNLPYIDLPENEALQSGDYPFDVESKRLSLALYLSSRGDEAGANEQIELIRKDSDSDMKQWREYALAYYAVHDHPQELFNFCLVSKACDSILSVKEIIDLIPANRFDQLEEILTKMGINYKDSGSYDFDGDGTAEKWLFFLGSSPCGSGTNLLIIAKTSYGIKSRYTWNVCIQEQGKIIGDAEIKPVESAGNLPVYQLTVDGVESMHFPFAYWPLDQENPTISVQEAQRMIDTVQSKFLLGQITPSEAQYQVKAIQQAPLDPFSWKKKSPPQVLYLLGLSYELNGQSQQAVETYLELWQTYPDSPYAYMAWVKLEPAN